MPKGDENSAVPALYALKQLKKSDGACVGQPPPPLLRNY